MAGWASNNKYALYGGMRSAAQMVSYEIPTAHRHPHRRRSRWAALNLQDVIAAQAGRLRRFHQLVHLPHVRAERDRVHLVFFICGLAETNRNPFDIPEAESELVAGFHTEYSGMRFAMFFLAEYAAMFFVAGLTVVLFLGGWHGPVRQRDRCPFFIKTWRLVFVQMWLRWTLPRLRVDQLMARSAGST